MQTYFDFCCREWRIWCIQAQYISENARRCSLHALVFMPQNARFDQLLAVWIELFRINVALCHFRKLLLQRLHTSAQLAG